MTNKRNTDLAPYLKDRFPLSKPLGTFKRAIDRMTEKWEFAKRIHTDIKSFLDLRLKSKEPMFRGNCSTLPYIQNEFMSLLPNTLENQFGPGATLDSAIRAKPQGFKLNLGDGKSLHVMEIDTGDMRDMGIPAPLEYPHGPDRILTFTQDDREYPTTGYSKVAAGRMIRLVLSKVQDGFRITDISDIGTLAFERQCSGGTEKTRIHTSIGITNNDAQQVYNTEATGWTTAHASGKAPIEVSWKNRVDPAFIYTDLADPNKRTYIPDPTVESVTRSGRYDGGKGVSQDGETRSFRTTPMVGKERHPGPIDRFLHQLTKHPALGGSCVIDQDLLRAVATGILFNEQPQARLNPGT